MEGKLSRPVRASGGRRGGGRAEAVETSRTHLERRKNRRRRETDPPVPFLAFPIALPLPFPRRRGNANAAHSPRMPRCLCRTRPFARCHRGGCRFGDDTASVFGKGPPPGASDATEVTGVQTHLSAPSHTTLAASQAADTKPPTAPTCFGFLAGVETADIPDKVWQAADYLLPTQAILCSALPLTLASRPVTIRLRGGKSGDRTRRSRSTLPSPTSQPRPFVPGRSHSPSEPMTLHQSSSPGEEREGEDGDRWEGRRPPYLPLLGSLCFR